MKVRKIKAMRDRQLRRHLADWWESTVTVRHYLHLLAAVRARQKARALGVPASEYLAKIEADPRRAAALQRARDRAAGVLADGKENQHG